MNKKHLFLSTLILFLTIPSFALQAEIEPNKEPFKSKSVLTGKQFMESLEDTEKIQVVTGFIKTAKAHGVTMDKGYLFYVNELIKEYRKSPELMDYSTAVLIKIIALMYGDWQEEGKAEEQVFRDYYGNQWEDMYKIALDTRKTIGNLINE